MPQDTPASKHALVSINGDCDEQTLKIATLYPDSQLVAVDGGLRHILNLGRQPDWLIGDLDSVDSHDIATLDSQNTRILQHPVEKDSTDLQLALEHLSQCDIKSITLIGISGDRLDHVIANFLLLAQRDWPFSIEFFTTNASGCLITSNHSFKQSLPLETNLSLLPLATEVSGVTTKGLYYPLDQATISFGSTLGISNVTKEAEVRVNLSAGKLLLIFSFHRETDS